MSCSCRVPDDAAGARLGALGVSSYPPRSYAFPVPGGYITSLFGPRTHPVTGVVNKGHGALDIGAQPNALGKPIYAPTDAVVEWRSDNVMQGGGRMLKLAHSDGWASTYMHLLTTPLVKGDKVKRGQVIAYMGNTGTSTTGTHLHWEVQNAAGAKVDPLEVLTGSYPLDAKLAKSVGANTLPGAYKGGSGTLFIVAGAAVALWFLLGRKK